MRKRGPQGQMRSKETHEHDERRARERPRCTNPRGMNEKMRRKEADNEEMVLVGSGSSALLKCVLHPGRAPL